MISKDLTRSRSSKQFEERLLASIREVGLGEPLKVAKSPDGRYVVVDGVMRLRAIFAVRADDCSAFETVPAYVVPYSKRFEIRYQTDIYQDLLPSQLAGLVEHLHKSEHILKADIARYVGVSPPTVRNYTGLWRMLDRGGLFARIVDLMDAGVVPSSNPYAWLRLTTIGVRRAVEEGLAGGHSAEQWIEERIARARRGDPAPIPLAQVEAATSYLPASCYRGGEAMRIRKRHLGLLRGHTRTTDQYREEDLTEALRNVARVSRRSDDLVLKSAAKSLLAYLK